MTRTTVYATLCLLLGLLGAACKLIEPTAAAQPADDRIIVQIHYDSSEQLNQLAAELDIWEINRAAQTLVARVTLAQRRWVIDQGLTVTLDCDKMKQYAAALGAPSQPIRALLAAECQQ